MSSLDSSDHQAGAEAGGSVFLRRRPAATTVVTRFLALSLGFAAWSVFVMSTAMQGGWKESAPDPDDDIALVTCTTEPLELHESGMCLDKSEVPDPVGGYAESIVMLPRDIELETDH